MKKVLSIILILCFAVSLLTGCSAKTSETETASETQELTGEISFSTWGSLEEKKVNEDIIKLFEEKHPGAKIKLEYIPDEYVTKIDTMFLGKSAPDVIYGHPKFFIKWASQGLLMDLTDKFNKTPELLDDSIYNTKLYDSFKYQGKHIATINGADTLVIFYNKDLFDQANVPYPNDEWTFEDLQNAAQKLTVFEGNKTVQYGISVNSGYSLTEAFMFPNGGRIFDDMNNPTKAVFNTPENIRALGIMQDLIYKYNGAPKQSDQEILGGGFDNGKIAMDITGVWAIVFRKDITDFKWDIANLPKAEGQERIIPALYAGYAVNNSTKNPELAWEFAKFMQSDEAQKLLASSGLITVINKKIATSDEVIKVPGTPDNHMLRVTSLDYAMHNDAMLSNWEEIIAKYMEPSMQQLLNNDITPEKAAEQIQNGLEKALKETNK